MPTEIAATKPTNNGLSPIFLNELIFICSPKATIEIKIIYLEAILIIIIKFSQLGGN